MSLPKKFFASEGFSLVELLVVVAIIAILASVVTLTVTTLLPSSRDGRRISDIKAVESALENYFTQVKNYPAGSICAGSYCSEDSYADNAFLQTELVTGGYLKDIPQDPKNTSDLKYIYGNPNNSGTADQTKFFLNAKLESKKIGENIFGYCNAGTNSDSFYSLLFSSYAFRTTYTNEENANCSASCASGVTCFYPTW